MISVYSIFSRLFLYYCEPSRRQEKLPVKPSPAAVRIHSFADSGRFWRQTARIAAFVQRMQDSNPAIWKQWLAENGPRLLVFARGWSPCREDAEALVQEAVLRLWNLQAQHGGPPPDLPLAFSPIRFC